MSSVKKLNKGHEKETKAENLVPVEFSELQHYSKYILKFFGPNDPDPFSANKSKT